ncbi:hypothetical protein [Nocardia colli]|uniref:hypothetical protein n=1 Tax=Nocardia colli TaxID=2545717 RepID=UPI0035E06A3E
MRKLGFLVAAVVVVGAGGAASSGLAAAAVDPAVVKCAKDSIDYKAFQGCITGKKTNPEVSTGTGVGKFGKKGA